MFKMNLGIWFLPPGLASDKRPAEPFASVRPHAHAPPLGSEPQFSAELPGDVGAAHDADDFPADLFFDHRPPRHEAEAEPGVRQAGPCRTNSSLRRSRARRTSAPKPASASVLWSRLTSCRSSQVAPWLVTLRAGSGGG